MASSTHVFMVRIIIQNQKNWDKLETSGPAISKGSDSKGHDKHHIK